MSAPLRVDDAEVVEVVMPYLKSIRSLGCRTLIDCTAAHLGRHPRLIRRLSEASGLHMLTVTGNYLAADGRFTPAYFEQSSVEQVADRWTHEWERGIDDTGIRPGLIKLGFNGGPLPAPEEKLIHAAARTHLQTGLVIAAHIGPWRDAEPDSNARSAFAQLDILDRAGVCPDAWIWMHAQNERDSVHRLRAAQRGAWVCLDGFRAGLEASYAQMIRELRDADLLHRVLVSQDAGWYTAGEPRGGDFVPFDPIFTSLIPALRRHEFGAEEIDRLFVVNPALAFSVRKPG